MKISKTVCMGLCSSFASSLPLKISCFCLKVLALVFIRKLLDFFFTKRELSYLDDLMPESKKKKEDDKKKKEREKRVTHSVTHFKAISSPV